MNIRRNLMMAKASLAACVIAGLMATPGTASAKVPAQPAAGAQGAAAPLTRADVIARLRAEFTKLDTNRDGYISQQELAAGLVAEQAQALAEIRQKRSEAFDAMDTNHDGQLSREEFLAAVKAGPLPDSAAIIAKMDTNKDGSLTFAEFSARRLAAFDQQQANQAASSGR